MYRVAGDVAGNGDGVAQFDVARTGGSIQVKARLARDAQLDGAGARAQPPFAARCAFNVHVAAARIGVHHAPYTVQVNSAGACADAYLAGGGLAQAYVAAASFRVESARHAVPLNVAAAGAGAHFTVDAVHLQGAGSGVRFHPAANAGNMHIAGAGTRLQGAFDAVNFLVAGAGVRRQAGRLRNHDRIVNGNVVPQFRILDVPNADAVAVLLNRRVLFQLANLLLAVVAPAAHLDAAGDLNRAHSAAMDLNVPGPGADVGSTGPVTVRVR